MRLEISNYAKIGYADLKFDGITVIAGQNNTGKTTVGKILFSMFNSLYDLDHRVDDLRASEIENLCKSYMAYIFYTKVKHIDRNGVSISDAVEYGNDVFNESMIKGLSNYIYDMKPQDFTEDNFLTMLEKYGMDCGIKLNQLDLAVLLDVLFEKLSRVVKSDRKKIANEMIFNFFKANFASQIQPLNNTEQEAKVVLTIKNHPIEIRFASDTIQMECNVNIMHEAYFIDDPFVIDRLCRPFIELTKEEDKFTSPKEFLINKLLTYKNNNNSVFETLYVKEKLQGIMKLINGIVPGMISSNDSKWTLSSPYYQQPVDFYNLSAGLKSFVLLKMLLEKGELKEKDILILDEPEIHLHPEWQLKYAEIIVLLQKEFDLNIVVTTHSRDFFEAIELYSKKHGISDKCNYYLSKQIDGVSSFDDVTQDTAQIYGQLIKPSSLLDQLRFALEDEDDD